MKLPSNPWTKICLLLALAGGLGLTVLVGGLVPIGASSGHFEITKSVLKFAMQRSVATHSIGIEVPLLDDPRLILLGAGHYESGCRFCHGIPGQAPPAVASASTPRAPALTEAAKRYDAAELFYIVRHGIKFTGMPAWPSDAREDEVWAVVAFLRTFGTMNESDYEKLVHGSARGLQPDEAPHSLEKCSRCHGTRGQGRGQAFPHLAAQSSKYIEDTLIAYAKGARASGIMQQVALLSERDRKELADWFSSQPLPPPRGNIKPSDPLFIEGERIAHHGIAERNIPSCQDCHGPQGNPNVSYPALSGQPSSFLQRQLTLFAAGTRGGLLLRS